MLSQQSIERAAAALVRGEAVILPTDTVPGLFILDSRENEEYLRELKGRGNRKPFARMFGSRKQLLETVRPRGNIQRLALERLLPGMVTLVLPSAKTKRETVGVRIPMDASLRALVRLTGPLIATSANLSGDELDTPEILSAELLKGVGLVEVESSSGSYRQPFLPSSVIDLTTQRPVILRKGALALWTISRRLGIAPYIAEPQMLNLLFVCGGNTCRSPMAEVLFKTHCSSSRVQVKSAGLSTAAGTGATMVAQRVMSERGLSLANHISRPLDQDLLAWADLVLVMTREHLLRIRREYQRFADRTFLLSGFPAPWPHGRDIADPIGGSVEVYRNTAMQIQLYIESICPEIERILIQAN